MKNSSPWTWIPSLYFAQGIPYVVVMTVSVIMYKRFGISNTDIALYTSWLYLPWVIKPLWSPIVDMFKTKRWWIVSMQILVGGSLAGVALTIPIPSFFQYTLAFFWLMAFSSATYDISADGFYMLGLDKNQQAYFVGIRSTFYRVASIAAQGLFVVLAGHLETSTGNIHLAWSITFGTIAALFILFTIYHQFILPRPVSDVAILDSKSNPLKEFMLTFVTFFQKKGIGMALLFLLTFRLGESQLSKIASPFLLDSVSIGGLGLSTESLGWIYGTVGIIALTLGGILGGMAASKRGLKYWVFWMTVAINLPNFVYVYLAYIQPSNMYVIASCVAVEQFGYGFGFTAYMLFMILFCEGKSKTAHYAICTGFMALGMMLPGMVSGWIQESIGYQHFFVWVIICTIPGYVVSKFLVIDPQFGIKTSNNEK